VAVKSNAGDPFASSAMTCARDVAKSMTSGALVSLNEKRIVLEAVIGASGRSGIEKMSA
jgi:hypothetical protein